jgi:hypothetical protein
MAPPGSGHRIAERFADGTDDYVRYLSMVMQHTQIDIPAYTESLLTLARDPELRRKMGRAGTAHAAASFDWSAIIPQYLALSSDLADRRRQATVTTPRLPSGPINPLEVDPFDLYAAYPTGSIDDDTPVTLHRPLDPAGLIALDDVNGRALYRRKTVPDDLLIRACEVLGRKGAMTVAALAAELRVSATLAIAAVLFLAKFDIVGLPRLQPK